LVRILYVHHGKGIGGAPLSLLFLIRGLDNTRYSPSVLCIHESEASELFRNEGIETFVMESIKDFSHTNVLWYPWWQLPKTLYRLLMIPLSYFRARRFLQKHNADLVHLNTSTLSAVALAARNVGSKIVWHIREPLAKGYVGLRRNLIRKVIDTCADVVIPICNYDASQLIASDKIHVVYNFVDFKQFDAHLTAPEIRAELGIAEESRIVLMLGGSNPIKGTEHFVSAAVNLAGQFPDVEFLIAGEIPEDSYRNKLNGRASYHRRIVLSIPEEYRTRIRFIGVRNDIPKLLSESFCLCFPSTVAHFARPAIEASAMAKPVIASDLGGPKELVRNNITGLLVAPEDSSALAEAMQRLLDSPERAEVMGKEGLAFAKQQFDADANGAEVQKLYELLLL
jgi:glycosyltransferase involved in cell wall biosynthesis